MGLKDTFNNLNKKLLEEEKRTDKLYAVSALFNTPNEIIKAAEEVSSRHKKFDVNTPYPLHGMDDAMRLKTTKLGFFTFAFGLIGTLTAFAMIGFMMGVDYKNIIGGKPFFAITPSVPIAFELTVLIGALGTVGVMIALLNRLPWINNPIQDTEYIKRTSSDKFGIYVLAEDAAFSESGVTEMFRNLGAEKIIPIYDVAVKEGKVSTPLFDMKFMGLLTGVGILTAIVTYFTLNVLLNMQPFDWMWKQFKVTPQEQSTFYSDQFSVRTPPQGTVPKGYIPYEYKGMPDSLVKILANPVPIDEKSLDAGRNRFNTYCSPCHGYYGNGDSRLKGAFPNPPTLHSEKVRNWADGNIYHVIVNGQNVMPSYAKQLSENDRWAIVNYIRALQRSQNALDQDLQQ